MDIAKEWARFLMIIRILYCSNTLYDKSKRAYVAKTLKRFKNLFGVEFKKGGYDRFGDYYPPRIELRNIHCYGYNKKIDSMYYKMGSRIEWTLKKVPLKKTKHNVSFKNGIKTIYCWEVPYIPLI